MKETRRLDVLAILGAVLVLGVAAAAVYCYISVVAMPGSDPLAQSRNRVLRRMPPSDLRADLAALSARATQEDYGSQEANELDQAADKYPNSARIQLHAGLRGSEERRPQALQRAIRLDPGNALPYYLLASDAASKGALDKAADLLARGNRQRKMTEYPIPYEVARGFAGFFVIDGMNTDIRFGTYGKLRRPALALGKLSVTLYQTGHTDQALALIGEIRQMGLKTMHRKDATLIDALIGSSVLHLCERSEKDIYGATGSQAGLAQVEKESRKLTYLKAGSQAYLFESMEVFTRRMAQLGAPGLAVSTAAGASAFLLFTCFVWWAILALRSRRRNGSETHGEATASAFFGVRLLKVYGLLLLISCIATAPLVYLANSSLNPDYLYTGGEIAGALMAIALLAMLIRAIIWYRKAYLRAQENPRFWRGAPAQEKREIMRRLVGFQGGMAITLALFGLLVCGYTKATMHAFPWQFDSVMMDMRQREIQYTADLVAGKVKVPQKYIDEVKREEARRTPK